MEYFTLLLGILLIISLLLIMKFRHLYVVLQAKSLSQEDALNKVLEMSRLFIDMDQTDDYYRHLLEIAMSTIPKATKGSFLTHNELTGRYEYTTCIGYNLTDLQKISFTLEETFLYKNAQGNYDLPTIIRDVQKHDSKFLDPSTIAFLESIGALEIQETLSSPVVINNKIVAILNIDSEVQNAFNDSDRQLIHFFATHIAIALKNKHLLDESLNMSRYDSLTGVFNRNYFEKVFNAYRTHSLENMESYSLVICDLNDLKLINDRFGHSIGDMLLVEFTRQMKDLLSDSDVFARIGGDEFAILIRNQSLEKASEKMQHISKQIQSNSVQHQGIAIPLGFSYGIASSPEDSMVYEVLNRIADVRMYQYKEKNKKKPSF